MKCNPIGTPGGARTAARTATRVPTQVSDRPTRLQKIPNRWRRVLASVQFARRTVDVLSRCDTTLPAPLPQTRPRVWIFLQAAWTSASFRAVSFDFVLLVLRRVCGCAFWLLCCVFLFLSFNGAVLVLCCCVGDGGVLHGHLHRG